MAPKGRSSRQSSKTSSPAPVSLEEHAVEPAVFKKMKQMNTAMGEQLFMTGMYLSLTVCSQRCRRGNRAAGVCRRPVSEHQAGYSSCLSYYRVVLLPHTNVRAVQSASSAMRRASLNVGEIPLSQSSAVRSQRLSPHPIAKPVDTRPAPEDVFDSEDEVAEYTFAAESDDEDSVEAVSTTSCDLWHALVEEIRKDKAGKV